MNWFHRIGLIGSILAFVLGFVLLHQGLERSSYVHFWFFDAPLEKMVVVDWGFFCIGAGFVL